MNQNTAKGLAVTVWILGVVGSIGLGAQRGSFWLVLVLAAFFVALGGLLWLLEGRRAAAAKEEEAEGQAEEEPAAREEAADDLVEEEEEQEEEELLQPISARIFVKPSGEFITCPHCGQRLSKGASRCFACGKEL